MQRLKWDSAVQVQPAVHGAAGEQQQGWLMCPNAKDSRFRIQDDSLYFLLTVSQIFIQPLVYLWDCLYSPTLFMLSPTSVGNSYIHPTANIDPTAVVIIPCQT